MVKILLSDDSDNVLDSMVRYLGMFDTEVHSFPYNDLAQSDLESGFEPDYILTDYDYGGGHRNGVDYIKALRANGITTPIALISGSSQQQLMKEVKDIPNVFVIEKGSTAMWNRLLQYLGIK
jgi:DNA-binding response OmpR family regulator